MSKSEALLVELLRAERFSCLLAALERVEPMEKRG